MDSGKVAIDGAGTQGAKLGAKLGPEDIAAIDDGIIESALPHWRKVAMVVSIAEEKLRAYVLCAKWIRLLAKEGRLESQGNLRYMRISEVRLPNEN